MELPPELRKLVCDIIDLLHIDEQRKEEMKQDTDAYIVSLLLHFKGAMMDPKSHSLHYSYAFSALGYRSLVRAQQIVGKENIAMVRFLEPMVKPYDSSNSIVAKKSDRYGHKKKRA